MTHDPKQLNSIIKNAYPQALSRLIKSLKQIHHAEDFLQSAVEQALIHWSSQLPKNPVAWLVTTARNRYIDHFRRQQKQVNWDYVAEPEFEPDLSEEALLLSYNDDLLRLIFTCCHPALNQETQIALSLKHVLGLNVAQIANALMIGEKTLEKRLTRAKQKILANNIRYQIPISRHWPERLNGVLRTIYLVFNEGYLTTNEAQFISDVLCKEAIRLARLLQACVKDDADVIGLLALLLAQAARQPARIDDANNMVLLGKQNRRLWNMNLVNEANVLVQKALRIKPKSIYAIQAAIACLHNNANSEATTDWKQIYGLYQLLIQQDSNPIIQLNSLIALAKSGELLNAIEKVKRLESSLKGYRHYYTSLGGLYLEAREFRAACTQYKKARKITQSRDELHFIDDKISFCSSKIVSHSEK